MCVIFLSAAARPTEEMVEKAWKSNEHGGGIAWRDGDHVIWRKGLNEDAMKRLCLEDAPLPFVAHFRVASVGGVKPELTHPFPVLPGIPLALEGRTDGYVLFHNGHWSNWQDACLARTISGREKVPPGPWSDSRALAWLSLLHSGNVNEFIKDQKIILFGPTEKGISIYGKDWVKIENVWCSNDYFMKKYHTVTPYSNWCKNLKCNRRDNLDADGYCPGCKQAIAEKQVTGSGGSQPVTPFRQPRIPTLAEVKHLYEHNKVSKTLMKKLQKCYLKMHDRDPKVVIRATERLSRLSHGLPLSRG